MTFHPDRGPGGNPGADGVRVERYLKNNGYFIRSRGFGNAEWVKLLDPNDPTSETFLDVCTLQDKNILQGSGVDIPWSIAMKWQRNMPVGSGEIFIPDPEPLIILKAKAAWDRRYRVEKKGEPAYLKDKITKDRYDVLSLLHGCDIDPELVIEIARDYDFKQEFIDALERMMGDEEAIKQRGLGDEDLKNIEEKVGRIVKGLI